MIHPTMPERRVKLGFSWSALLFSTAWGYSEGLIAQAGRMVVADAASGLLGFWHRPVLTVAALMLFVVKNVYCGLRGGTWLLQRLQDQGYRVSR